MTTRYSRRIKTRRFLWIVLGFALFAFGLAGCVELIEGTPTPLPKPASPTPGEPVDATATPQPSATSPSSGVFPEGRPTVVPVLYKMFDWGTDYQQSHPEWGPIGSIQFVMWEDINPGPGSYNWEVIDAQLALEAPLKVTLPDGREIPKPVVIQVFPYISSYPGWKATYYDGTPIWVYDRIDGEDPNGPRPVVGGRKVGHALTGCGTTAVLPMFDSPTWRNAYYDMIRAFGARYNNHPQVTSVVINTGLDGETQPVKDLSCDWNTLLDQQSPDVRYNFGKFMKEAMAVYRAAFPDKPIFINNAPGGSGVRKETSEHAATFDPPIGLKHSGMWVDLDSHQGYGNFTGSWDMIRAYSQTLPIWLESPFGLGAAEHRYWSLIAGLHYHPDAIDCHPEYFPQSDPEWLLFAVEHLGVSIKDTPDVWTVLRDSEFPLQSWGAGGVSGHMGDWTFWLYQREGAPQSDSERVWREEMPAARDHVYSRQTRRTDQASNNIFFSFDIDDEYPYVGQKPLDVAGGNAHYVIHVTLLNRGEDTFSLQYRNWDGGIVTQPMRKGSALGPVNDWVTVRFVVSNGYMNNGMPGNTDFRISCERDGDEYIHMVRVTGGWGVPPTPTITPVPSETPLPTATSPPGSESPTPSPIVATPVPPPATTPTMIPNAMRFVPEEDTYLDQWAPTSPKNGEARLAVRQGGIRAPLFKFDLSSISDKSYVERAVLSVGVAQRSNDGVLNVELHKVLRPWDGLYSTWERATRDESWTVSGCNDPMRDRSAVAVTKVPLSSGNAWYSFDVTALVQDWVSDPESNHGLIMRGSGVTSVEYSFYSSDHSNREMRPRLYVVAYETTPTPVTPSATPTHTTPTATITPGPSPTPSDTPPPTHTPLPSPTVITLQEGAAFQGVQDTFLDEWSTNANYVGSIKMIARQGSIRAPLLRFDLSSIPQGYSVKHAHLRLYATSRTNPSSITLSVAKVLRKWDPDAVTWNQATSSDAWFQAGARDTGADRSVVAYDTVRVDGERQWVVFDITYLVQEWVSDPETNYGMIILAEGGVSVQYDLTSSSWRTESYRPSLEIEFIAVAPSPTPIATETPTRTPTPDHTPTPTMTPFPPTGQHVFQQSVDNYVGVVDTFVDKWNPSTNNRSHDKLIVRQGGVRSVLLRFNIEGLPISSHINEATLQLFAHSRSGANPLPVQAYGLLVPWESAEATYQRASKDAAWHTEGAMGLGTDLKATPADGVTLSSEGQWVDFDITTLAQEWVTWPERNQGLAIHATGDVSVQYEFASSEWWLNPSQRPKLYVDWEPAPPTPTVTGTPPTPTATPTVTPTSTQTPTPTPTRRQYAIKLQQGLANYNGTADSYIDVWYQQSNMGRNATIKVRQNDVRLSMIRFDLRDQVPHDAIVKDAVLNLYVAHASNQGALTLEAYSLKKLWDEDMVSWLESESGVPWMAPGASGAGEDRSAQTLSQTQLQGAQKWVALDVAQVVREWVAEPSLNHGILLRSDGSVSVEHEFASAQWQELAQRPNLQIWYEIEPDITQTQEGDGGGIVVWIGIGVVLVVLFSLLRGGRNKRRGDRETKIRTV